MSLWNLLFPPKCVLCGKLLESIEMDLCHSCRCDSPMTPPARKKLPYLDSWTAVWYYEGSVRRSLLRYKFRSNRAYAASYGRLLAMKLLQEHPDGFDCLTWIPISPIRKLQRGFDQVELLARYVGKELSLEPVRLLRKVRHNRAQAGIDAPAKRKANVLGVYRAAAPDQTAGKRILLLDDIVTTGATAGEASRVLLNAGAKEVHLGAVAASPHHAKK